MYREKYLSVMEEIIEECRTTLAKVKPEQVEELITAIFNAEKVFFTGVGRVKLSLDAMAKRLAHLGIHTVCVGQITEPAITPQDLLVVGSGSGESLIPVAIAKKAKEKGAKVAYLGANAQSTVAKLADVTVRIPAQTKLYLPDETESHQPMTSLFEQCLLLLGDTIAKMIIEEKKIEMKKLWQFHANLE